VTGAVPADSGQPSAADWVQAFAARVGVRPPTDDETEALLGAAGVAARASERTAAPVTTWLAAKAGLSAAEALALAKALAEELQPAS
jgi:hypothetical protein